MRKEKNFNQLLRYILLIVISVIIVFGILIVFQREISNISEKMGEEVTQYENYYVIIADESDSILWESIYSGAVETGIEEANAYVEFIENDDDIEYTLQEKIRIAIDSSVDGIIISSDDVDDTTELIDEAIEKGIEVVTVLNDATDSLRQSYVGVNNYSLGETYGSIVWEYLTQNQEAKDCTISILMDSSNEDTGKNTIYLGLKEYLENAMYENDWLYEININAVSMNREETFIAEETIGNIIVSEDTDIVICLNAVDTETAYRMIVDYNQVGNIEILGYYESEVILEAIEKNIIHSTITVSGEEVGRQCVLALYEYQNTGYVNGYYPMDIQIINEGNVTEELNKYELESEVTNE